VSRERHDDMKTIAFLLSLLALLIVSPSSAPAMDQFEIQVYQGEHNEPGQASVELHTNYTLAGRDAPAWAGETPPRHVLRMTLEPAFGVTSWLELGAYLQTLVAPAGGAAFGGWKLRSKFILPPRLGLPLVLGLNVEIGRVPRHVEEEGWANEFRPIVGIALGRFALTFNPIFGFALTGPDAGKPDFEPAFKGKWNTNRGLAVGVEHYASLGRFDEGFVGLHEQEHLIFAVLDWEAPEGQPGSPWELNFGIGRALTDVTAQRWIAKAIVGRAF
jgi:hypothetical protein